MTKSAPKAAIYALCPACGQRQAIADCSTIDAAMQPDSKTALLQEEFFTYTCRHCHRRQVALYPLLYRDSVRRCAFYLLPEGLSHLPGLPTLPEEYTLRLVKTGRELAEKIKIADAGGDDRCIELCKLLVMADLTTARPDLTLRNLYFDRDADGVDVLRIINDKQEELSAVLTRELYHRVEALFSPLWELPAHRWYSIDHEWAISLFNRADKTVTA